MILGLMILLLLFWITILLVKNNLRPISKYHFMEIIEQLTGIILYLMKSLFIIFIITFLYKSRALLFLYNKIIVYKLSGVILGSFIASFFGILTQTFLQNRLIKLEIRKYARLLYNDIQNSLDILLKAKMALETYVEFNVNQDPFNFLSGVSITEIDYDPHWREYYSYLTEELSISYYNIISRIYKLIDRYNKSIKENNISLLSNCLNEISSISSNNIILPSISCEDLLDALYRLSRNKKVRSRLLFNLWNEFAYFYIKKQWFSLIEEMIVKVLSNVDHLTSKEIEVEITKWLANQDKYKLKPGKFTRRLIFEILLESSKIDLTWNECRLRNKSVNKE